MHDRHGDNRMNISDEAALRAALHALPQSSPPADLWPALAARVQRRQRTRQRLRIGVPLALAACLALVVALPLRQASTPTPAPAAQATTAAVKPARAAAPADDVDALRLRSQRLQAWVGELARHGAPLDGAALARVTRIEDQIGLVDLQLGAGPDATTRQALWSERVALLQRLAMVRLSPDALAARGERVGRSGAMPAVWIN
ncbi:MAG TPA: hypothetical protein VFG73_09665 [Rhodanobacteraceae bacterium]|nr:hypothetical protein [Rhodanobacteraceae bacterium]